MTVPSFSHPECRDSNANGVTVDTDETARCIRHTSQTVQTTVSYRHSRLVSSVSTHSLQFPAPFPERSSVRRTSARRRAPYVQLHDTHAQPSDLSPPAGTSQDGEPWRPTHRLPQVCCATWPVVASAVLQIEPQLVERATRTHPLRKDGSRSAGCSASAPRPLLRTTHYESPHTCSNFSTLLGERALSSTQSCSSTCRATVGVWAGLPAGRRLRRGEGKHRSGPHLVLPKRLRQRRRPRRSDARVA